ncbi:MAG: 5'-nucleotidase C-terminal domain-containing protein [Anaerotignum sp.]|nr:5'-nucleotidase C-terminal domain-containing protein [Anaerotignum sp.]
MKLYRKMISVLLTAAIIASLSVPVLASDDDITVFYTNDIHTYIDNHLKNENGLSYSKVAALKDSIPGAILVDAGDHLQGTAYGEMDKGMTMIELMNAAGYDLATFGNHEFDYSMTGAMAAVDAAEFSYISCNFCHEADGVPGDPVAESWKMLNVKGKNIAFIGITTPETISSTTPSYFMDEAGNFIYGFHRNKDGSALYDIVQKNIDEAEAAGADYIIALGHLGIDPSSAPWTSHELIANTEGLDAFIDGHSHTTVPMESVANKNGDMVVLTQTGSYLNTVGKMTISSEGILTELLTGDDLAELKPDMEVKTIEDAWIAEMEEELGTVIGYSEITLNNYDENGNRLVRMQETNSGDFAADALYYLFDEMELDVDVAVMNGGGIRNNALRGDLSYYSCKEMHPFGNVACLLTVTGQQLLDVLEWASKDLAADGSRESGSFLHISGARYTLDISKPSTVQQDINGIWTGAPTDGYRVKNLQILNKETGKYEPVDLNAKYNLAGHNYTLRDLGGGFAMLKGAVNVLDYAAEDYMVLANYIQSFPVDEETGLPTITEADGYSNVKGEGRITISAEPMAERTEDINDPIVERFYETVKGDSLWKISRSFYGTGTRWNILYNANRDQMPSPDVLKIGQTLMIPDVK